MTEKIDQKAWAGDPRWAWAGFMVVTVATLGCAPFMGLLRDALLERFPETALKGLAVGLAAVGLIVFIGSILGAARRSDSWDWRRGLWLVAGLVALAVQIFGFRTSSLQVDIVEKVHIVQYGLLAFLAAAALGNFTQSERRLGFEHVWMPICLGTIVGVADESIQGFFQLRTGDIRDVGLNALAALTGACFAVAVGRWQRLDLRPLPSWRPKLAWMTALCISAAAGFFYQAHLGYVIRDPELGRFHSWFTPEQLSQSALDRQAIWAESPPTGLKVWARQDYYLTEAAWHANHRNERLLALDYAQAQVANRILEKYYDPFLDVESFRGTGKHRWDPSLKADVASKAEPIDPTQHVSPVLRHRIYPWRKSRFAMLWVATVVVILWLGHRTNRGGGSSGAGQPKRSTKRTRPRGRDKEEGESFRSPVGFNHVFARY